MSNHKTEGADLYDELGKEPHTTDLRFYISSSRSQNMATSQNFTKGFVDVDKLDVSEETNNVKVQGLECNEISKTNTHHLGYDLMGMGDKAGYAMTDRSEIARDIKIRPGSKELNLTSRSVGMFEGRHKTQPVIAKITPANLFVNFNPEPWVQQKKKTLAKKMVSPKYAMKNTSIEQFKLKKSMAAGYMLTSTTKAESKNSADQKNPKKEPGLDRKFRGIYSVKKNYSLSFH